MLFDWCFHTLLFFLDFDFDFVTLIYCWKWLDCKKSKYSKILQDLISLFCIFNVKIIKMSLFGITFILSTSQCTIPLSTKGCICAKLLFSQLTIVYRQWRWTFFSWRNNTRKPICNACLSDQDHSTFSRWHCRCW